MHQPIHVSIGAEFEQCVASYGEISGSETGTLSALTKTITNKLTETTDLVHGHLVVSERDVAQRVPQSTSTNRGARSDHFAFAKAN